MTIEVTNRRSLFMLLKPYCSFSKENDYIEVTEWSNGEGWDVNISSHSNDRSFSLTYGQAEALQVLLAYKD